MQIPYLNLEMDAIVLKVFELEKHERVYGYRVGVNPSGLFGPSSNVRDLQRHCNESKQYLLKYKR